LKVLNDAGLLAREKRGTWVYYRVVRERVADIARALALPTTTPCDPKPRIGAAATPRGARESAHDHGGQHR
jgi:DNA-binding transcriptional ArsR family regulator